ncbi:hypothetical protein AGMMS50212_16320 [Spirochaetia bacterium]|nr:hypothetical protein AGMMS50212_16320 [Spirochaetia bacterium]
MVGKYNGIKNLLENDKYILTHISLMIIDLFNNPIYERVIQN